MNVLKRRGITFILVLLVLFPILILASEFTTNIQSDFDSGTYGATEYNSSGFVQLARNASHKELASNGAYDGHINMSGNVLLLHLNNNSDYSENNTYIYDFSGNNHSGTWYGDASPDADSGPTTDGKLNGAFMFDKTDDAIEGSLYGGTEVFTISAWIKPSAITGGTVYGCAGFTTAGGERADIYQYGSEIRFFYPDGTGSTDYRATSSSPIGSTGEWYHIMGTNDGSTQKVYVNGEEHALGGASGSGTYGANAFWVSRIAPDGAGYHYDGLIDEVAIWNRTLSATEISEIYNRTKYEYSKSGTYTSEILSAGSEVTWNNVSWISKGIGELPNNEEVEASGANMSGNVVLYHLNNETAYGENNEFFYDFSGNENNGSCSGADCPTYISNGKFDGGYDFDGNDRIGTGITTQFNDFSVEVWFKDDGDNKAYERLADKSYTGCFWLGRESSNANSWGGGVREGGAPYGVFVTLEDEEWHQIVSVRDGTTHYIYGDGGKVIASNTVGDTACGTTELAFGAYGAIGSTQQRFTGELDEVSFYNRALSAEEIEDHYKRGVLKLNLSARSCDDSECDNETWTDLTDTSSQQLSLNNNTYFQYKFEFGGDGNYTPELYNITVDYNLIPSLNHYYIRTYQDNSPESYFANQSIVQIKSNGTFTTEPTITITDSEGTTQANQITMTNESNIFTYNYTLNGSQGWYDVIIDSQTWSKVFYQSEIWSGNYTDEDSNAFTFRREFNVTEPGTSERFFEPVEININFTFEPHNNSIRLLKHNGSDYFEIPHQIYEVNKSENTIYSGKLVLLSTLDNSETEKYFLISTKSNLEKTYLTDLTYTNNSEQYEISNSYYTIFFNSSTGGLIQDIKDQIGLNLSTSGVEPMEYYPQFDVGLANFAARSDNTVEITTDAGPIIYVFNVSGQASDDSTKPYSLNCKLYSKNYYLLCEKNQSTTVTQNWKNFYLNGLVIEDGKFTNAAFRNSSDDILTRTLGTGDSGDNLSLDSNIKWLAFYDNSLGDAIAEIYLDSSYATTNNPGFNIIDDSDYEYYQSSIIDSTSTSVSADSSFYTKTAKVVYNGLREYSQIQELYENLQNPLTVVQSQEETSDNENPIYTETGNLSYNDTTNVTLYSYWTDDSFLSYATINITGPGINGSNSNIYYNASYPIRDGGSMTNESYVNITLNSSEINHGQINCSMVVYDVSGKSNSTLIWFNISDATNPSIVQKTNYPNSEDSLDPNITVQINSTIIEYSNLGKVLVYYRNNNTGSWSNWNTSEMTNITSTNYNYTYNGNFTPTEEALYQYFIFANDTFGNEANSTYSNISIIYDYTWSVLSNLTADSGVFDTNISLGNITINNTGDYNLSFKITAGVLGSRVYINETLANTEPSFLVQNNTQAILNINATTRPSGQTEGTDTITLTISNSSANPTSDTTTVDVITITGGPFLYTTLSSQNTTVYPGDKEIEITLKVENLGNETATNVNGTITLPDNWNTMSDLTPEFSTINVGSYESSSILVDLSDSAETGVQTIQADSECSENKTGTGTLQITVASQESGDDGGDDTSSGGGSGGGGGGSGLSEDESARFFQSTQVFEITRGEDQEFTFVLKNPYEDATLRKLNLALEGFTEEYINFFPNHIRELQPNKQRNITVQIKAPGYFTRGEYKLLFTITGEVKKNITEIIPLTYTKTLLLYLRDVSREDAIEYKDLANFYLEDMQNNNFYVEEITELNKQLNSYFDQSLFKEVKETYEKAKELYKAATESNEGIQTIEEEVNLAIQKNIEVSETERLLSLAKTAFKRGDFLSALSRINEAKLTLAIETGGKYVNEAIYIMKSNKKETATSALALFIFTTGTTIATRFRLVKRKLKKLNKEQSLLMDLMKAIQIEVFEKARMSMKEYGDAMSQYEERLNKIMEERILFENKKQNLMKFKSRARKLNEERNTLRNTLAEVQKAYITQGKYETRVYENMLKSYSTRLSEVEEKIALMDVKKAKK